MVEGAEHAVVVLKSGAQIIESMTVEQCLAELRELVEQRFDVIFRSVGWIEIVIWADSIIPKELLRTRRSTLEDCMAQVRAWVSKER